MDIIKSPTGRVWKIDCLRGIAVVMMIIFHILYDMYYFSGYPFALYSGFWWLFARATAGIFVFLVGISLTLSYSRARPRLSGQGLTIKYLKRGLKIFGWGLLITAITWLFLADRGAIWFGVLHLIGISIILARPLLRFERLNLVLGLLFICVGSYLYTVIFMFPWLLPLGLRPAAFYSLDYLPIFPWFGIVLLGMFIGKRLFPDGRRKSNKNLRMPKAARHVCFLGRHSLLVYLLHQPVLVAVIYLLFAA
jgi:uncharacterized membrane protein